MKIVNIWSKKVLSATKLKIMKTNRLTPLLKIARVQIQTPLKLMVILQISVHIKVPKILTMLPILDSTNNFLIKLE